MDIVNFCATVLFGLTTSILAFLSFRYAKRVFDTGLPRIRSVSTLKRDGFIAVSIHIVPGDRSYEIISVSAPGCQIADAYMKNDVPHTSQMHLWELPPEENFKSELPLSMLFSPGGGGETIKLSIRPTSATSLDVRFKLDDKDLVIRRKIQVT